MKGELLEENSGMREKLGISPRLRDSSTGKPLQLSKQQASEKRQQETRALMQVFYFTLNIWSMSCTRLFPCLLVLQYQTYSLKIRMSNGLGYAKRN